MALPSAKQQSVWCPRCRDFGPTWIVDGKPVCLRCGRVCSMWEPRATRAAEEVDGDCRLVLHRICCECKAQVDEPQHLIRPWGYQGTPSLSQWLCMAADALVLAGRDRRGVPEYTDGPIAQWRIWCPECRGIRQFRLNVETVVARARRAPKPHEFQRTPQMCGQQVMQF